MASGKKYNAWPQISHAQDKQGCILTTPDSKTLTGKVKNEWRPLYSLTNGKWHFRAIFNAKTYKKMVFFVLF